MLEVTKNLVPYDNNGRLFNSLDANESIRLYLVALLDAGVVVEARAEYAVVPALPDPTHFDEAVAPEPVLSNREYAVLPAVLDRAEQHKGVPAEHLDSRDTLLDLTSLHLRFVSLVNTNSDASNVLDFVPQQHLLRARTPTVNARYRPVFYLAVLHQKLTAFDASNQVFCLAHRVNGAPTKTRKTTYRDDHGGWVHEN